MTLTDAKGNARVSGPGVVSSLCSFHGRPVQHGGRGQRRRGARGSPPSHANVDPEVWVLKASVYAGRICRGWIISARLASTVSAAAVRVEQGGKDEIAIANAEWNQELILKLVVPPGKGGIANIPREDESDGRGLRQG